MFSEVNADIYQELLVLSMLLSAHKPHGDADLIFQLDSAPAHAAKVTRLVTMVLNSKLARPELCRESVGFYTECTDMHSYLSEN